MDSYNRILEDLADGKQVDSGEVLRVLGNVGKPLKQVLLDMKAACDRREWCFTCKRRGVIRSSRKNAVGERIFLIICPECKETLSNQKRGNHDFVVYTQPMEKKDLDGSEAKN